MEQIGTVQSDGWHDMDWKLGIIQGSNIANVCSLLKMKKVLFPLSGRGKVKFCILFYVIFSYKFPTIRNIKPPGSFQF